jgi:tetratricopeptide (TPR) repeat protein
MTAPGDLSRAAEAEWTVLERHLQLAGGFWLGFVFSPSAVPVEVMRARTAQTMEAEGRSFVLLAAETPDELLAVLGKLLAPEALAAGCVWVEAIREDPPGVTDGPWARAWQTLLLRMNERRDMYRKRLPGGLMLAGPPGVKTWVREGASDLWSVRVIVVALAPEARIEPFPLGATSLRGPGEAAGSADAGFALAEAERRGKRGGGAAITQAAALVRAAKELVAEGRAEAAEKAAREAAELLRGVEAPALDYAEALATLAAAERAIGGSTANGAVAREAVDGAAKYIAEALRLAEGAEVRGVIEWYALDVEIALTRGDRARARQMAGKAVALARRLGGDVVGNLVRAGDLARAEGEIGVAKEAYDEALALARKRLARSGAEDPAEAREKLSALLLKLAEVNREQGNDATARAAHDEALGHGAPGG